jgi:hypothetical protein
LAAAMRAANSKVRPPGSSSGSAPAASGPLGSTAK